MTNFKFFHNENGRPMLYVFLLKPFKWWNFEKNQVKFLAQFFHKKIIVFKKKQIKIKIFLNFCFASTDSLKAVTGCFENFEISAKRVGLKNYLNQSCSRTRALSSSLLFNYQDVKSIFDRTMVWFDRFSCFEQKKYSIWSGATLLQTFIGLIQLTNKWTLVRQGGRMVKVSTALPIQSACVVLNPSSVD